MRRVLVTRPEPGASATARALRSAGFDPFVLPLTAIRPLPVPEAGLPAVDAIALTSANAIRHAPDRFLAAIGTIPLHAVGATSAQAAHDAGFANVIAGPGDAAGLETAMGETFAPGSTVLYLCGKVRRLDFELGLRGRGIRVIPIEIYDTVPADVTADDFHRLNAGHLFAVLVYSAEATRALAMLATRPAVARSFEDTRLIAISRRAAMPAEAVFAGRIAVAREPTEAAMLEALAASG